MIRNLPDILNSVDELHEYQALRPIKLYKDHKFTYICKNCGETVIRPLRGITDAMLCQRCKLIATNRERYGIDFLLQRDDFKEHAKNVQKEKYGGVGFSSPVLAKKTETAVCKKYGVVNVSQSDEIKQQKRNTTLLHYGVECSLQNSDVRERGRKTCKEKYGTEVPYAFGSQNFKRAIVEKYGVESYSKTDEYKSKYKATSVQRYGVEHPFKNHAIFCKAKQKYEYDGLKFDSKPEIEFYKKLKENFTDFEYQPDISFEYEYEGRMHTYWPDFRIGNTLYEIKGSHFFDENGKMINPFDRCQDGLYDAKHQCMITNGINIIKV